MYCILFLPDRLPLIVSLAQKVFVITDVSIVIEGSRSKIRKLIAVIQPHTTAKTLKFFTFFVEDGIPVAAELF